MARSTLLILRDTIFPSRRKLAEAAESAKEQLLLQRLANVLGVLEERERQLLDFAQRLVEE